MTIKAHIEKIETIQREANIEIPWDVWTSFAGLKGGDKIELHGNNISFGAQSDFKTLEGQRKAVEWLVSMLDGKVSWK